MGLNPNGSMKKRLNKIMSAEEAVAACIQNGDMLSVATFCNSSPYALIHEVIRQRKKDLTLLNQSCFEELDLLVAGGCARRVKTAYVSKAGLDSETPITRAFKKSAVEIEEYSNFTFAAMLEAGMQGLPFGLVTSPIMHSDIFNKRTFAGADKFRVIKCPYTGQDVVTVPALNPDVAILHAQRADKFGNVQFWGTPGSNRSAAMAAKRIIVSVEEIVDNSVIKDSYQFTILPGIMVDAVVLAPFGGHPSEVMGYYRYDKSFRGYIWARFPDEKQTQEFLNKWVYGVKNHQEYLEEYVKNFGVSALEGLKSESQPGASIQIGTLAEPLFDETGYSQLLEIDKATLVKMLEAGTDLLSSKDRTV